VYLTYFLATLLGYFFGAFPTGYIAGRMIGHVDVREMGSGRTGGTNVLRSAGRTAAIITIVGDIAKGTLAVIAARLIWGGDPMAAGALLALHPVVFAIASVIPLLFTYITLMTSIGSLLGSAIGLLLGLVLSWTGHVPVESLIFFVPFFVLSWYSHRPNLARLRAGNERRIGEKAKAPS
jgi:glycerol-3-phosphate acyltransferase PlsY